MYLCASGPHVGPVVGSVVGLAAGCAIGRTVGCAVGGMGASDEACSMTAVPRFAPHSEQNLADSLKAAPHSPQNLGRCTAVRLGRLAVGWTVGCTVSAGLLAAG